MLPAPGRTKKNALQMKVTYGPVKKRTTCTQENFPKKHVWFAVRRANEPVSCPPAVTVSKGILFGAVEGILAGCAEKDLHGAGEGTRAWGAARCRWSACSICKLPPAPKNPKLGARGAAATRSREASRGRCRALWRGESSDLPSRDLPTAEFREAAQLAA